MNLSLFRSRHALLAILAIVALILMIAMNWSDRGVIGQQSHALRIWTGVLALSCMSIG